MHHFWADLKCFKLFSTQSHSFKMTYYRRYKACYPFEARGVTELSMSAGDTLLVQQNTDGSWPPPEKWMQGFNEITQDTGEFPGGQYVQFVEEFCIQPEPPSLPEKDLDVEAPPPVPSPRHASVDQNSVDQNGSYNGGRQEEEEEADDSPPPPPPPRRGLANTRVVENHVGGSKSQSSLPPPQALPRPNPRRHRRSVDAPERGRHRWVNVTFRIPVQCAGCKFKQREVT